MEEDYYITLTADVVAEGVPAMCTNQDYQATDENNPVDPGDITLLAVPKDTDVTGTIMEGRPKYNKPALQLFVLDEDNGFKPPEWDA